MNYKIFSLGDGGLTVEFGNEISAETNNRVLNLARSLDENPFQGLIEIVPAYASLTVFYDVLVIRKNFPADVNAFETIKKILEKALQDSVDLLKTDARFIEIPVCFDKEFALDLEFVASKNNLLIEEVIEIFLAPTYRVYMLGFLPGFAYMGEVDERIAASRKSSPRLGVPQGSVGIAGRQTGIYSLASPGGWQIIGKTDIELFTPKADSPTFLQAGDSIKFVEVDF